MPAANYDIARSALFSIDPNIPRREWAIIACAWFDVAGWEGEDDFVDWSSGGESFVKRDAHATYRWASKPSSGKAVGGGTLFWTAEKHGFVRPESDKTITKEERQRIGRERYLRRQENHKRRRKAEKRERRVAKGVAAMLNRAEFEHHPYLVAKGFPSERGFVLNNELLIPMIDGSGRVWSLQRIDPDGNKLYLSGGRASGMRLNMGSIEGRKWFCEGYATALSIRTALRIRRIPDTVVMCFSSDGIVKVSKGCKDGVVVADHDWWRCGNRACAHRWDGVWPQEACPQCGNISLTAPAGEKSARDAALPWWMPPAAGDDANDFHQQHGTGKLGDVLRDFAERNL